MLQTLLESRAFSLGLSMSVKAKTRMWVSRLSIGVPRQARREKVAADLDLALEAADQHGRLARVRDQLGHGLAVLRDHEPVGVQVVEQRQALLLEFRRGDGFHDAFLREGPG